MFQEIMHFPSLLSIENCIINMSSSPKFTPQAYHEKHISQIPIEGHFTKSNDHEVPFEAVKVLKNKDNLRNCPSQDGPKEI